MMFNGLYYMHPHTAEMHLVKLNIKIYKLPELNHG